MVDAVVAGGGVGGGGEVEAEDAARLAVVERGHEVEHVRVAVLVVGVVDEGERRVELREGALVGERPAVEHPGQGRHVGLCVARVHPEGVEFHDLAGVVLVELARETLLLVEVDEHGRAVRGNVEQVREGRDAQAAEVEVFVPLGRGLGLVDPGRKMVLGPGGEAGADGVVRADPLREGRGRPPGFRRQCGGISCRPGGGGPGRWGSRNRR